VGQDSIPGTKLTVMLGGHWWDGWDTFPDEEEAASMAKAVLARHLKITEEPRCIIATLQKDCIPQYTVGHSRRMKSMQTLLIDHFKSRLRVAGSSYTGVGLNDCVRSAFDISATMVPDQKATGLEGIINQGKWELLKAGESLEW
jgi:oxygen-dependent protoporphyrinogen oxidase